MRKRWQRGSGLVRWTIWSWRQWRRVAGDSAPGERALRQERAPCAPDGADEAAQVEPAVAAELRVLVALYEASRRELPGSLVAVAGDEPGEPVRHAVVVHVLMSQTEVHLWESVANRRRLEVDDVVHAAALCGLKYQLKHAGDEISTHVAAVCEGELIARLGLEDIEPNRSGVESV